MAIEEYVWKMKRLAHLPIIESLWIFIFVYWVQTTFVCQAASIAIHGPSEGWKAAIPFTAAVRLGGG